MPGGGCSASQTHRSCADHGRAAGQSATSIFAGEPAPKHFRSAGHLPSAKHLRCWPGAVSTQRGRRQNAHGARGGAPVHEARELALDVLATLVVENVHVHLLLAERVPHLRAHPHLKPRIRAYTQIAALPCVHSPKPAAFCCLQQQRLPGLCGRQDGAQQWSATAAAPPYRLASADVPVWWSRQGAPHPARAPQACASRSSPRPRRSARRPRTPST